MNDFQWGETQFLYLIMTGEDANNKNACARKEFITETLGLGAMVASMKLVIINQWVQVPPG
jgi:hypothetical protein